MELNPYSPPAHAPAQPFHLTARPSKVASWFSWLMRGGNGPGRRDPRNGKLLLSASFFPLLLAFCLMVIAPLCVMEVALVFPPARADINCPLYLITLFELIGLLNLLAVFAVGQVTVSPHSIQVCKPFCNRQVCWRDIVYVRLQSDGSVLMESSKRVLITVESCLTGLPEFIDALENFLPTEVRIDCRDELDDYRKFIGPCNKSLR